VPLQHWPSLAHHAEAGMAYTLATGRRSGQGHSGEPEGEQMRKRPGRGRIGFLHIRAQHDASRLARPCKSVWVKIRSSQLVNMNNIVDTPVNTQSCCRRTISARQDRHQAATGSVCMAAWKAAWQRGRQRVHVRRWHTSSQETYQTLRLQQLPSRSTLYARRPASFQNAKMRTRVHRDVAARRENLHQVPVC
jgi:hypothetical protein